MIFLEKSELPFSKCPTKNYITPSPEYMSIPLKRRNSMSQIPISRKPGNSTYSIRHDYDGQSVSRKG